MSRQQIAWVLVAIIVIIVVIFFATRELGQEQPSAPGQNPPHAIDQSQ